MKIFLWANYSPEDKALGMSKKIRAQIETFRKMGHEVYYSAYHDHGAAVFDNDDRMVCESRFPIPSKKLYRYMRMFMLTRFAADYLKDQKFDLAYIRWTGLGSDTIRLLKAMRSACGKTVMDSHGYFKGQKSAHLIGKYLSYTSVHNVPKVKGLIDLVLTETDEKEMFGAPAIKYDNGVDTAGTRPHNYTGSADELNLISVANEQLYHGYDRLVRSIAAYTGTKCTVKLHLVGVMSQETKNLAAELGVAEQVVFYGKRYGTELDDIYDKCNLGAGPVGQHRVGGKKGTGLKTKEYFAKGLPYIYAGNELVVPKDYPYIMEIPSDESMIDFDAVYQFYRKTADMDPVGEMRAFAVQNFSWEKVYNRMFENL